VCWGGVFATSPYPYDGFSGRCLCAGRNAQAGSLQMGLSAALAAESRFSLCALSNQQNGNRQHDPRA
jgi:hypothetical protein